MGPGLVPALVGRKEKKETVTLRLRLDLEGTRSRG